MKRLALVLAVCLAAAAAPVSSGLGTTTTPERTKATTITVTGKEFSFTLSKKSAKAGKVTFKFTNKGKLSHDFKIDGKKTPILEPGKVWSIRVTLKKGKKYPYLCTVPGHAAAGMKGTFKAT
jgi:uncharacterized cupredoxin-like copper-binding protein